MAESREKYPAVNSIVPDEKPSKVIQISNDGLF